MKKIEVAKESGLTAIKRNDMELEDVHRLISLEPAQLREQLGGANTINLDGVIQPHLTSKKAQQVYRCKGSSTVIELLKNMETGACFPWYRSELSGYEYITKEAIEGMTLELVIVFCRCLCKLVKIDSGDTDMFDYWIKRFAATFVKLADAEMIKYGVLMPFSALLIADLADGGTVKHETSTKRIMLMVYPYSHLEVGELNEWLGNEAFVKEGAIGSYDWSGLPEVK